MIIIIEIVKLRLQQVRLEMIIATTIKLIIIEVIRVNATIAFNNRSLVLVKFLEVLFHLKVRVEIYQTLSNNSN